MNLHFTLLFGWIISSGVLFAQTPTKPITLSELSKLPSIERLMIYQVLEPKDLINLNSFIPALINGLNDPEESIRTAAAGKTAYSMIAFQALRQQGQPLSVSASEVEAVISQLKVSLNDPSAQVRGPAIAALIYSNAPTLEIESILLGCLAKEDFMVRNSALKDMAQAGYQSAAFKDAALAGLSADNWEERAKAADVIACFKPAEALPMLARFLKLATGDVEALSALHEIVNAISCYGQMAVPYIQDLQELESNPLIGGTLKNCITSAIASIRNPSIQPAAIVQLKPVPLFDSFGPNGLDNTAPIHPISQISPPSRVQKPLIAGTAQAKPSPVDLPIDLVVITVTIMIGFLIFILRHKSK